MKCSKLRRLLADGGPAALAGNQKAEDHLVDCSRCFAVLEGMAEIDRLLPELESHDVADDVVEQLLARPELETRPKSGAAGVVGRFARVRSLRWLNGMVDRARQTRLRWGIVAVPAMLLIGLISVVTMRSADVQNGPQKLYVVKQVKIKPSGAEAEEQANRKMSEEKERLSKQVAESVDELGAGEAGRGGKLRQPMSGEISSANTRKRAMMTVPIPDPTPDEPGPLREGEEEIVVTAESPLVAFDSLVLGVPDAPPPQEFMANLDGSADRDRRDVGIESELFAKGQARAGTSADNLPTSSYEPVAGAQTGLRLKEGRPRGNRQRLSRTDSANQNLSEFRRKVVELEARSVALRDLGDIENADLLDAQLRGLKKHLDLVDFQVATGKDAADKKDTFSFSAPDRSQSSVVDDDALTAARRFLAARDQVDGLSFREARGYWANTYVPGDRTLRQLKARLDRAAGAGATGTLHDGARQISQPFDPPDAAALAVYLHSDRRGVETRERLLVQVGLKGTSRRSGMRPPMNVGLVLDLRGEITPATATSMRALLAAFAASTELGDRFSLTVAGRPGGTILPPGDLRHGPLTVAMAELFGDEPSGMVLSLDQAVAAALATVRADDDPNAPLGSSALIVVTAQRLGGFTGRLAATAHRSAVDGVPWSVIGIGQGVDLAELDALVLAGQGNRRLLTSAADAESLVDRELAAVSRVVARAVRLRIRLAPGVQLVDVIGSERLDERRSQQVRDAEQAVDQRLSRNLGIQTDRGLDEDGIQIVIPSFYADNAHVVLLDVVVPGPGPVADVTVRYKDVVHMKNGVARAHLRVGRSESADGPLERNVLANLVATEVASRLDRAADAVAGDNVAAAQAILSDTLNLVRGITSLVEGLAQDPDLEADIEMLAGYLQALSALPENDAAQLRMAADSLRYAGRLKVLPPPVDDDEPAS
ncbi:MAG: hypothetical protein ACC742_06105 [Thermoanaerobaculales bacterium]